MSVMTPASAAGLGAAAVQPIYSTHAMLNVGDELRVQAIGLSVTSVPASRLQLGVDPTTVLTALTEGTRFDPSAPSVIRQQRFVADQGAFAALAWTVTAAAVRLLDRRDLDPLPGGVDGPDSYTSAVWNELWRVEQEVISASRAHLFAVEQSPPVLQTAANIAVGGVSTVTYAVSDMGAATLVVAPLAMFLITAAPIAGKVFGEYLSDLIERLPGSRAADRE
jgi:hypothetical protein